jgi:CubicO group peptidase (beta-lactamase class C family)
MKLESASPKDIGLSASALAHAKEYAQRVGDQLGSPGGAVLVIRHDRVAGEWYWGKRGRAEGDAPFDAQTMIPLASVTKGATATALALLIQDGQLWLDDPAHLYIPELGDGDKAQITVRHLATHSSGLPAGDADFYGAWRDRLPDEHPYATFVRHALMRGLAFAPDRLPRLRPTRA